MSAVTTERRFITQGLYFQTSTPVFNGTQGKLTIQFFSETKEIHSAEISVYKTAITTSNLVTVSGHIVNVPCEGSISISSTEFHGKGYRLDSKEVTLAEAIALRKFTEYRSTH